VIHTGRCECRGVSYRVDGPMRHVSNCHCGPCRRITGHFMAAAAARTDDVTFDSEVTLRWYPRTDEIEYGFCGTCGSTLFWRTSERPETLSIAAGTLDPPTGLETTDAIFVGEASDYHVVDATIPSTELDRDLPMDWAR